MRILLLKFVGCSFVLLSVAFVCAAQRAGVEHRFEQYAVPLYRGPHAKPNFNSDPGSIQFRTRIREGIAGPVNFAGEYALVIFGCGTDCIGGFLVNVRTGWIGDLPLGGEANYRLTLDFRPKSKLLKARWIDTANDEKWFEHPTCVRQEFVLTGSRFKLLNQSKSRAKDQDACFPGQ